MFIPYTIFILFIIISYSSYSINFYYILDPFNLCKYVHALCVFSNRTPDNEDLQ